MRHLLFILSFLILHKAQGELAPFFIGRGEILEISVSHSATFLVGHQPLLQVSKKGGKAFLKGKKIGSTFLSVDGQKRKVHILGINDKATLNRLRLWQEGKRGPEIQFHRSQIYLKGRLLINRDLKDLQNHSFEKINFKNAMDIKALDKRDVVAYLDQQLLDQGLDPGRWSFLPQWTHHLPESFEKKKKLYDKVLKDFGVTVELGTNFSVRKKRTRIKVYIVQTSEDFHRKVGVQPPTSVQGQVLFAESRPVINGETQFSATAIEKNGWGKVVANPTLVVNNGEKAHFHSGGEYPIQNSNTFVAQVSWKKYGILLDALPTWLDNGRVNLNLKTEISFLDHSNSSRSGIPSLIKSELSSDFQLQEKQILLISGLVRSRRFQNKVGWPWLQQIPILSHLVSEKSRGASKLNIAFLVQVLEDDL